MQRTTPLLFAELKNYVSSLNFADISAERKEILQPLIDYLQFKVQQKLPIQLNFICTHNSRRSHLSQIWAQTAAAYFELNQVYCYSGGTEETALFPMIAKTLQKTGFDIQQLSFENNPVYAIKYAPNAAPIIGFSKKHDHHFNPENEFAALMTCSQADEGCPFIAGAEKRIPLNYDDPKAFDNSPMQEEKYAERSKQIATELFFVFSQIIK